LARAPTIGKLRWWVQIAKRVQAPEGSASISEGMENIIRVRADIQPLGPMTFIEGSATDRPITDRIYIRWLDWLDTTHVIVRETLRLDRSKRLEIFRIRKVGEFEGRKRFLELLCEQENRA
jgi:head-tail adaptor